MKKILLGLFFLTIGFIFGLNLYTHYQVITKNKNTYYFLQEGVYQNKSIMEKSIKNINNKLVTTNNNLYYVYLGITKNINNAKKIVKLYQDRGHNAYIKEMTINNKSFANNVSELDALISNCNSLDDILTVEEVILSNYEEITKK